MANEFPPFIFHDPVEARQMENWANNAAKADLMKQESLLRMAELGLRKQQAQETAELNRLITASQLQQRQAEQQFRERELTQRGELESARNKNYLEGLRIQFPEGRTTPEAQRQAYDKQLREQEEQQEASLAKQLEATLADLDKRIATATTLEKSPKRLEGQHVSMGDIARVAANPIWGMSQLDYSGQRNVRNYLQQQLQREPTDEEISQFVKNAKTYRASPDTEHLGSLQQRKTALMNQLTQYGWIYDPAAKKIIRPTVGTIPTAGQIESPPPGGPPPNIGLLTTPQSLTNAAPVTVSQLQVPNVGVNSVPATATMTNAPLIQRRYTRYLQRLAEIAPNRVPTVQDKLRAKALAEADVPQ